MCSPSFTTYFTIHWLSKRLSGLLGRCSLTTYQRKEQSNHEYAKIGYSPINKTTQTQADQLEKLLKQTHPDTTVRVINRYTAPFAEEVVPKVDVDDSRIFVLTMYPHFCHSTTATSVREVDRVFLELYPDREIDSTRIYSWWHNSSYLEYTYEQIRSRLEQTLTDNPEGPVSVMFSAHGLPKKYRIKGEILTSRRRRDILTRSKTLWRLA